MSNATGQSATAIAVSSCSAADYDFMAAVRKYATKGDKIKGNTKDVKSLKRNKLISGVCARFRDSYPSLFEKRDADGKVIGSYTDADGKEHVNHAMRVPPQYFDKIVEAVDAFITETVKSLCADTMEFQRRHVHKAKRLIFVEVRTLKDEQEIDWAQQRCACNIQRGNVRRRIEDANLGGYLTPELQVQLNAQMVALDLTLENIEAHIPAEELARLKAL